MERLFIGIPFYANTSFLQFVATLKSVDYFSLCRWIRPDNYHLTLRFIGDYPSSSLPDLIHCLSSVGKALPPFTLDVNRLGLFVHRGKRGVLWAGVAESPALNALHDSVNRALFAIGFAPEVAFKAHITLARFGRKARQDAFARKFIKHCAVSKQSSDVKSFVLYRSILKPTGSEYEIIETFALGTN